MASSYGSSHAHEHEWRLVETDDFVLYEDDSLFVYEECSYIEQKSVGTSARHDETFYETMYECEGTKRHRWDIIEVTQLYNNSLGGMTLGSGADALFEMADDNPKLVEDIDIELHERLTEGRDGDGPEVLGLVCGRYGVDSTDFSITVDPPRNEYEYRIDFEYAGSETV